MKKLPYSYIHYMHGKDLPVTVNVGIAKSNDEAWPMIISWDDHAEAWFPREDLTPASIAHEGLHLAEWAQRRLGKGEAVLREIVPSHCPSWQAGIARVREEMRARLLCRFVQHFYLHAETQDLMRLAASRSKPLPKPKKEKLPVTQANSDDNLNLTKEQRKFLDRQKIPTGLTMDASGLAVSEYRPMMSDLGLYVAYGVTPCRKNGHTMRTRTGSCVQCSPEQLAHLRRVDTTGHVYVARSRQKKLTKIGFASDAATRIESLRKEGYADAVDWELVHFVICSRGGRVELAAQNTLREHRVARAFKKGGRLKVSKEVFSCSVKKAINAVDNALGSS
jgi:hypothetical protein